MLSKDVYRFIEEIKALNTIGCITVDEGSLKRLLQTFESASLVLTSLLPENQESSRQKATTNQKNKTFPADLSKDKDSRMPYIILSPQGPLPPKVKPCLWVVTEEDYSNHPTWAREIREQAQYFLNVR